MKRLTKEQKAFEQGYVCAVSVLVSSHGDSTMVRDVLKCNIPSSWKYIESYDRSILEKIML